MSEIPQSPSAISDGAITVEYGELKEIQKRRQGDVVGDVRFSKKRGHSCCIHFCDMRRTVIAVNVLTIFFIVVSLAVLVLLEVRQIDQS